MRRRRLRDRFLARNFRARSARLRSATSCRRARVVWIRLVNKAARSRRRCCSRTLSSVEWLCDAFCRACRLVARRLAASVSRARAALVRAAASLRTRVVRSQTTNRSARSRVRTALCRRRRRWSARACVSVVGALHVLFERRRAIGLRKNPSAELDHARARRRGEDCVGCGEVVARRIVVRRAMARSARRRACGSQDAGSAPRGREMRGVRADAREWQLARKRLLLSTRLRSFDF